MLYNGISGCMVWKSIRESVNEVTRENDRLFSSTKLGISFETAIILQIFFMSLSSFLSRE